MYTVYSDCYLNMGEFDRALVDAKVAVTLDGSSAKVQILSP
jgi:hypothetical protein